MPRKVQEWIGKTPDTKVPPRVRLRVYDRHNGVCHICKLPIKVTETWHADHVQALIAGGENRETNLAPAHGHCNLAKAAIEVADKSKVARTRAKHIGVTKPKGKIKSPGFQKVEKPNAMNKADMPELPRRRLYV